LSVDLLELSTILPPDTPSLVKRATVRTPIPNWTARIFHSTFRPHRSTRPTYVDAPIVTDRVAWSVGRSVTLVSPAKTAAPIEMPFGLWARMGRRNHVLDGGPAMLRDVAMATNFGRQFAIINGFVGYNFGCMVAIATRCLILGVGFWGQLIR